VRGERFFRVGIELAGADVPLDRGVELPGVEGLEPGAKPRQFARGKRFDGFLDVFGGGHVGKYSSCAGYGKGQPILRAVAPYEFCYKGFGSLGLTKPPTPVGAMRPVTPHSGQGCC
jgi:hypothetical protein